MIKQKTEVTYQTSEFSTWLSGPKQGKCYVFSDFDGTITDPQVRDTASQETGRRNLLKISHFLQNHNLAMGIHSARSFGEVYFYVNEFLKNGAKGLPAFSSSEHGTIVFCPRLSADQEDKLEAAGLPIFRVPEYSDQTIFNCAKCSAKFIAENIIEPVIAGYDGKWASSYTHSSGEDLIKLNELARHNTIEETVRSCVRFGSCYLKIKGEDEAIRLANALVERAKKNDIYALYSPPHGQDGIHGLDFSPGTDKGTALDLIFSITKILTGGSFPTVYFGDNENDIAAFRRVLAEKGNKAYLVESNKTASAIKKLPEGAVFLEDKRNIEGVRAGLEEFLSSLGY